MADSKQAPLDAEAAAKAAFASVQDQPFPSDIFTAPELRWAVIGCGVIANQMAQSLALAGRKLAGVANRTLSKAQAFADQYGIEKVYDTVEDLYADPNIDAVYITTPHNTHITYLRVALAAGKYGAAVKTAGVLRKLLGAQVEGHMDAERYEFCWIVDFPMYEIGEESGELEFCHNPFSMPQGGLEALERAHRGEIDPLTINAYQYDLVCNGVELSSGAVRNHDPEIMIRAFELVGLGEADVKAKFPAMYNAFCYGAPPHAGIAPGVDRMVMLLAGEDSIREVIPFPMNKNAQDLMMDAPSAVDPKQLADVHIAIVEDK